MAGVPMAAVIRDFARYSEHRPEVEPDVIETMVDFKESFFGDGDPARWRAEELRELMLEILPRKVSADEEWFGAVGPTTRAYIQFLSAGKRLARGSDPAPVLLAAVDRIGDGALVASRDPRNFGMAKSIFSTVGFDPSAPDPGRAMMEAFNALTDDQRSAILDPSIRKMIPGAAVSPRFGDTPFDDAPFDDAPFDDDASFDDEDETWPPLPLIWLPPAAELAGLARAAPLVRSLLGLAGWIGDGRKVTKKEVLPLPAAQQACADLGLALPATPVKAADRIPALHRLWSLAVDNDILAIERGTAVRGEAVDLLEGPGRSPEDVVLWWADLLDSCLEWGLNAGVDPGADDPDDYVLDGVDEMVTTVLAELYPGQGLPASGLEEVATAAAEVLFEDLDSTGSFPTRMATTVRQRWAAHLAQLVDLGAATVQDDIVSLTPLGQAGVRTLALADGADAPVIDDPAALDAGTLLENLPGLGLPVVIPLMAAWSAAHPPERAMAELLDTARTGSAQLRMTAVSVLMDFFREHVTGPGRSRLEELRDDPVLGLSAHILLADPDDGPMVLPPHLRQWAGLEAVAAAADTDVFDVEDAAVQIWEMVDADADLDSAWRCTHPQLIEILEIVAELHPTGRTRKAAKKALFKARHPEKTERAEQARNRGRTKRPGHPR